MNVQHVKDRLLDLKNTLTAQTARAVADGRQEFIDSAHDAGDASVADETASEAFTEAEQDSSILAQVIDALKRVDDGTFGQCVVDGEPIDGKRLEAEPWTPYCLKHATLREASSGSKMPTL
jgi:DnaK suppressor protein